MSTVKVESLSSASEIDRPLAFFHAGRRHRVQHVLSRNRLPQALVFTVRTTAGRPFRLTYDLHEKTWHIQPLEEAP